MQPITYSLILNLAVLAAATFLSWQASNPLILIIALVLQTHALQKFQDSMDEEDEDESQPMGFLAKLEDD